MTPAAGEVGGVAADLVARLRRRGLTLATCESVTGGQLVAAIVSVPGVSRVVRGGLVTYATDLKTSLAQVSAALVATHGVVSQPVALAMADGARTACGADIGVATTGVAGPRPLDGVPVGTVCLAVVGPDVRTAVTVRLGGDRAQVRAGAVTAALELLRDTCGR